MNTLQLISKYRNAIMGVAILWVFIFHIFPYDTNFRFDFLKILASLGYAGVDIFLFVSGFGLYYGYGKYKSKGQFYKKRFLRIIPTYLVFIILTIGLSKGTSLLDCISMFFNLGWFIPQSGLPYYNWYMTAIMLFYLAFPFYMVSFKKQPIKSTITITILSMILTFIFATFGSKNAAILITRIPIFSIGVYASYLFKKKKAIINNRKLMYIAFIFSVITICLIKLPIQYEIKHLIIWNFGFYWIPFILITPGLLIFLTLSLEFLSKKIPKVLPLLNFLGTISLEIYLIHVNTQINTLIKSISSNQTLFFIYMLVLSIAGGYAIHKIMESIMNHSQSIRIH